jgi:hypothetical protein
LSAGLTIQPCKKVIVMKPPKRGGQGPKWALKPYDGEDDDGGGGGGGGDDHVHQEN